MGRWGRNLVDSVAERNDAIRFVAGTTRTRSRVEEYAHNAGLRLHDSYEDLLADDIDAVVLATPHMAHFGQLMAAADAGKHVYCEKPFCLTAADAKTALAALGNKGLKAAIGHNRRFAPNTQALQRTIKACELGDMIQIEGNFAANMAGYSGEWRDHSGQSPAGGMTSLGIHVVDMFINFFGPVSRVHAVSRKVVSRLEFDDATTVLVEFENGRLGYLGTVSTSGMLWQVRAFGTKGWGEIFGLDRLVVQPTDGPVRIETWDGYEYPGLPTIAEALEAFARDCEGGEPFPVTPRQIEHGTAVLEAVITSAGTGKPVDVA